MTMVGPSVAERLKKLEARIRSACARAGRAEDSARILAVSKHQGEDLIREAVIEGQIDFGENYVQEASTKVNSLDDLHLRWHFIGRIQSNKIKNLVGRYFAIHSVDRLSVAQQLNRLTATHGGIQNIFLQFNVADEESKGGAGEAELEQLFEHCKNASHLRMMGLMVMPPLTTNGEDNRVYFARSRGLLERFAQTFDAEQRQRHPWNELSMGTSSDFEIAVEEGSTLVRIGTELFGARPAAGEMK